MMTPDATVALQLNRVYLPTYGFMKEFKFEGEEGLFTDVTSFEFILEALVAHSACEIVLPSWGEDRDSALLDNVPQALRRRVKFVDQYEALKLANSILLPVFDEFSIEYDGLALSYRKPPGKANIIYDAIPTVCFSLREFLLGLRHRLQIDIDVNRLKKAVSIIRRGSRNPEGRANMSVLEGILGCYTPVTIGGLNMVPQASKEHTESFISFLEDATFEELSKESFGLGLPSYFKKSAIRIKQLVRKIVSNERFRPMVNAASKPITIATGVPLPDAELVKTIIPSPYLPPIISLQPALEEARIVWERLLGDKDLAERYRKSTS